MGQRSFLQIQVLPFLTVLVLLLLGAVEGFDPAGASPGQQDPTPQSTPSLALTPTATPTPEPEPLEVVLPIAPPQVPLGPELEPFGIQQALADGDIIIAAGPALQQLPAIAYNQADEQYLVVWMDDETFPARLRGQILSRAGVPASEQFTVVTGNLRAPFRPEVAYSPVDDSYMAVWSEANGGISRETYCLDRCRVIELSTFNLYAMPLAADGKPLAESPTLITGQLTFWDRRLGYAIAYNRRANEYLVVWEQPRGGILGFVIHAHRVFGQRLNTTGGLQGSQVELAVPVVSSIDVAYSSVSDEYLVTWDRFPGNITTGFELYAQRIRADTLETLGSPTQVSQGAAGWQAVASLAYGESMDNYLVTWEDTRPTVPGPYAPRVFGQVVQAGSGNLVGGNFEILEAPDFVWEPDVAYSPVEERYLVVGAFTLNGRYVSPEGGLAGDPFLISTRAAAHPRVAARVGAQDPAQTWAVVWDMDGDIFGRLIPEARLPVILIPGYPGTELVNTQDFHLSVDDGHGGVFEKDYSAGQVVWINEDEICENDSNDDYFDVGKVQADGITPVNPFLVPTRAFEMESIRCTIGGITRVFTRDQFGQLIRHLESLGYIRGVDLFTFGYDFRRDVGPEGWPLPPFADPRSASTIVRLDNLVDQALDASGAEKVVLIGHSLGGLVIRQYLLDVARANKIGNAIILGTPFMGTAKALLALELGLPFPEEYFGLIPRLTGRGIDGSEIKDLVQNFPAHYEILPTRLYFQFYDFYVNEVSWDFNGDGVISGPLDYDQTRQAIARNHDPDANIVSMAERFHAQGMDWSQSPPGVEINILAGCGTGTTGRFHAVQWIESIGPGQFIVIRLLVPEDVNGDGTVVLRSTDLFDPARGLDFRGNARVFYAQNLKHGELLTSNEAHQFISFLLGETAVRPSVILDAECQLRGWRLSNLSAVQLHVFDSQGRHTGLLDPGVIEEGIAGSTYEVIGELETSFVPDGDVYQIELLAIDSGVFDLVIQELDGHIVRTVRFEDVEVVETSRAALTLDTTVEPEFVLRLDRDGDGTFDVEIQPVVVLDAQESQDRIAPTINILSPEEGVARVGPVPFDWEIREEGSGLHLEVGILDPDSPDPQLIENHSQVAVSPGRHTLRVLGEDRAGNGALAEVTFDVFNFEWLPPLTIRKPFLWKSGWPILVRFRVKDLEDRFVADESVTVSLVDETGAVVVGPITRRSRPAGFVFIGRNQYLALLRTKGLPAGAYQIVVSFDSQTLKGEMRLDVVLRDRGR